MNTQTEQYLEWCWENYDLAGEFYAYRTEDDMYAYVAWMDGDICLSDYGSEFDEWCIENHEKILVYRNTELEI